MNAVSKAPASPNGAGWHPAILELLPRIERYARTSFRQQKGDAFDNAVQGTIRPSCLRAACSAAS